MTKIRKRQEDEPLFERFIPPEIVTVLRELKDQQSLTNVQEYNKWFYEHQPTIPKSSVKRWTRAWVNEVWHDKTSEGHTRYREDASIIPDKYSSIMNGEYREHYDRWQAAGEVRYVNLSCLHRPFNDSAIWNLQRQIISDFKPNVFPVMSDTLDADAVSRHPSKPHTSRVRVLDEDIYQKNKNKFVEFKTLSLDFIEDVKEVVPSDCSLINLWGNHEYWYLSKLLKVVEVTGDVDLIEYYISSYFDALQEAGVLWVEADRRIWTPLIKDMFWVSHGNLARSGEGATAKAYMAKLKNSISVAVGHSHRQEVLWTATPTGERFVAICGTGGPKLRGYNKSDWVAHNWGFQTITHPTDNWRGVRVEDVRIHLRDGYYVTHWRDREYSEKATIVYDELFDYGI